VAASGVDVVYPRQHAGLWREMVRVGAVLSETPPGQPAQAWRFPSRNRLIAGLAEMVVVVECHARGGSWHTVDAATKRGTDVGAVPGSVRSAASVGTNRLLHEGAVPVRGAQDVLDALGIFDARPAPALVPAPANPLGALDKAVLAAVGWRPLCLDEVVERSGVPVTAVVVALERLEDQGAVRDEAGWWVRKQN
jgi:DNA processing protein